MKANKQLGFSLLEILIAFTIMALSLGILLNIFSGGVNTAMVAEDYTVAVQIAESLIAKTGSEIKLEDHQSSGTESDKYHWQLAITPYIVSGEKMDVSKLPAELFKVTATVNWGEDNENERQIQLNTLKLVGKDNAGL